MPMFNYQGRTSEGASVNGKRIAQSTDSLAEQLLKEGVTPILITPEKKQKSLWFVFREKFFEKKVSIDELSIFTRQMYTLYSSGVSLTMALRQLSQTTFSPKLSEALFGMVESLEGGKDLATAMQSYPSVFTPLMISMVRIGQDSGRLDEAFNNLYQYLELESGAIKQIKTIFRYPAIVLLALIFATAIIVIFVIPTFAHVFAQANIPLPLFTQVLISITQFIAHYWYVIILLLSLIIWGVLYYLHTPTGKYQWGKHQLNLPVIGNLLRRIVLLRFAQSFSVVVKSGIPLIEGLNLVSQSIQNTYAQDQIHKMRAEIQRGKTLTQAALTISLFTPLELQMLSVSEETGELSNMLDHLSRYYQKEVDYNLKKLGDILEPILILGVAILVLGLALAVYLPIWNLIKLVHA